MQSNVTTVAKLYAFSLPRFFFLFFFSLGVLSVILWTLFCSPSLSGGTLCLTTWENNFAVANADIIIVFFSHVEEQSHARRTRFNALPRTSHFFFFFLANVTVEIFHWNRKRNFFLNSLYFF